LIPFTSFKRQLFPETKITVIANFFYAIKQGNLSVVIDGEEINESNVEEYFHWCEENLEYEQDEINIEAIKDCFKSIRTIVYPTVHKSQQIPNFGRIDWYIRMDDSVDYRAVAIARESGMLITRRPPNLLRFPNVKHFDMFVFVNQGEGSAALKRLENPEHDNFQFDRIKGASDARAVETTYRKLTSKVRDILRSYAPSTSELEEELTDLGKYLFDSSPDGEDGDSVERGTLITVSKGLSAGKQSKLKNGGNTRIPGGGPGSFPKDSKGKNKKGRNNQPGTGSFDSPGGTADPQPSMSQLDNLRVIPIGRRAQTKTVKFNFTAHEKGEYYLTICRASETNETETIRTVVDGQSINKRILTINEPGRHSLTIELENPNDANFALEGWISEV
jgi:hypothetical protein